MCKGQNLLGNAIAVAKPEKVGIYICYLTDEISNVQEKLESQDHGVVDEEDGKTTTYEEVTGDRGCGLSQTVGRLLQMVDAIECNEHSSMCSVSANAVSACFSALGQTSGNKYLNFKVILATPKKS